MSYKIKFLGVGNAFTVPLDGDMNSCDWQSNLLVIAESGKMLLLDCGSDARFSLAQAGHSVADIDAVYVSHAHADHIGGLEWAAFSTFFNPNLPRPKLFCAATIEKPLWDESLKGGLDSIEGRFTSMTDYFDVRRIPENGHFVWEGIRFDMIQVVHFMSERVIEPSYGLMIYEDGVAGAPKIFWTSDTQHNPNQIKVFYDQANLILHDCETSQFPSGVHAHYSLGGGGGLISLPDGVKGKMLLYHYHPGAPTKINAAADGFIGFAFKQQVISVHSEGFDLGM